MAHHANRPAPAHPLQVRRGAMAPAPQGYLAAFYALVTSSGVSYLLQIPTIGFYTFATFINVIQPDSSVGSIVVRVVTLVTAFVAFHKAGKLMRMRLPLHLAPLLVFAFLYICRLSENVFILGVDVGLRNDQVFLIFILNGVLPAYLLAACAPFIDDAHMRTALSGLAILFLIGTALNYDALVATADARMLLDKINPISLAYTASSFMFFYMLDFARSRRAVVEALVLVPILLLIAVLARSRGMMISSGLTILIYVLLLKGSQRLWVLLGLVVASGALWVSTDAAYFAIAVEALARIDTNADASTLSRVISFNGAWRQFLDAPLFGRYAIELQTMFYPHNIYLESLMAVGIIGTIPLAMHTIFAIRAAVGFIRAPEASFSCVFISLIFIREAIGAAASGSLWGASSFWVSSAILITLWYRPRPRAQARSRHQRSHPQRIAI